MGLRYSSSDSSQLISVLSNNLKSAKSTVEQLKSGSQKLTQTIDGNSLSGAAYTAGKGLFKDLIIPTINRTTNAIDGVQKDLNRYESANQSISSEQVLDSDNLKQQIAVKKAMKKGLEDTMKYYDSLTKTYPIASFIEEVFHFNKQLSKNIRNLEEKIKKLEKKLKKLNDFKLKTNGLFHDSLNNLKIAMQGVTVLNNTKVNSDGTYTLPKGTDKSWFTKLQKTSDFDKRSQSRKEFEAKQKAYKKSLKTVFKLNPNGTIQSVNKDGILKLLADGNLSEADKEVLLFYLQYQVGQLINRGSTFAQITVATHPLLLAVALALGVDLKDIYSLDNTGFKNFLEKGLYSTPGLNSLIKEGFSFEYDAKNDYYYTNENGTQSHFGFGDMYDHAGIALGMDLDTSVYQFTSNGKEYRFQLWKGTYGNGQAYGAEQGWYVRDVGQGLSASEQIGQTIGGGGWQPVANEANQIRMVNETYSSDEKLLISNDTKKDVNGASNGTHFWNLAIKSDEGQNKSNLYNIGKLYIPDAKIREELFKQMAFDGSITNLKNNPDGTITYTWGK
ncbi:MAG: DUF4474 domain-containing protein [Streptococcaceae bacterium]|nr:DUF4474 domain-containing protein [Streptococcaceae bacterium]